MPRRNRNPLAETKNKKGRPKKFERPVIYRTFPIYKDDYEAFQNIVPDGNVSDYILTLFENHVKSISPESCKIDKELEEARKEFQSAQMKIETLEMQKNAYNVSDEKAQQEAEKKSMLLMETVNFLVSISNDNRKTKNSLSRLNLERLDEISDISREKFKAFWEEHKRTPSRQAIEEFLLT